MFDELNRGMEQFNNPKEDALNEQDTKLVVDTMDSIVSELVDDYFKDFTKGESKAAALALLSDRINNKGSQNRAILLQNAKRKIDARLAELRDDLGSTTTVPLSSVKTLSSFINLFFKDS